MKIHIHTHTHPGDKNEQWNVKRDITTLIGSFIHTVSTLREVTFRQGIKQLEWLACTVCERDPDLDYRCSVILIGGLTYKCGWCNNSNKGWWEEWVLLIDLFYSTFIWLLNVLRPLTLNTSFTACSQKLSIHKINKIYVQLPVYLFSYLLASQDPLWWMNSAQLNPSSHGGKTTGTV